MVEHDRVRQVGAKPSSESPSTCREQLCPSPPMPLPSPAHRRPPRAVAVRVGHQVRLENAIVDSDRAVADAVRVATVATLPSASSVLTTSRLYFLVGWCRHSRTTRAFFTEWVTKPTRQEEVLRGRERVPAPVCRRCSAKRTFALKGSTSGRRHRDGRIRLGPRLVHRVRRPRWGADAQAAVNLAFERHRAGVRRHSRAGLA